MNNKTLYDIGLIAPPWWLIPSKGILTATEHLVEDYAYNLQLNNYKTIIFSRKKDHTDSNDIVDINNYKNDYLYTKVNTLDRKIIKYIYSLFTKNKYNYSLLFYLIYILRVAFKIKKYKINKIIVFNTFSFCYWIKLINPKCEIIYHIGNHELSKKDYYNYGFINNELAFKVLPKIDKIITVSKLLQNEICTRFPTLTEKCYTVYPGINTNLFRKHPFKKTNDKIIIIYSGRVVYEKGVHLLVQAFKDLTKIYNNIELHIVGINIGPNMNSNYVRKMMHPKIKFYGLLPRKELAKVLKNATIFVHPVIMEEPLGLAPLEAMACGLNVIVSDINSGYKEIITKDNGHYFANNEYEDLKLVLENIIINKKMYDNHSKRARNTIVKYLSWNKCIYNTVKLFKNKN